MKKSKLLKLPLVAFFSFLAAGCATTLQTTIQRPAEFDLHGANSISVLPFTNEDKTKTIDLNAGLIGILVQVAFDNDKSAPVLNYLTNNLTSELLNSGYFSVVGPALVKNAIENNTPNPADVYLTGFISPYQDNIEKETKKDSDGNTITEYIHVVSYTVNYKIIDSRTNNILGIKSKQITNRTTYSSQLFMKNSAEETKYELDNLIKDILRQLKPYETTRYVKLAKDKLKSTDSQLAHELAKNNKIVEALSYFEKAYEASGDFNCGLNIGKMYEAQNKFEEASLWYETLYKKTGNKEALTAKNAVDYEISQAKKLLNQQAEKDINAGNSKIVNTNTESEYNTK